MLKDITFGQYYSAKSFIHSMDPRVKIVLLILLIVFIFVSKNAFSLLLCAIFIFAILIMSRIPIKLFLKNLKAILPILIFTAIINMFYKDSNPTILFEFCTELSLTYIFPIYKLLVILLLDS